MNKSSFISDNQQKNTSSFFNQSIHSIKDCCQYRIKYEQLYKQMSNTRIDYRNLKQSSIVLKNTVKGLEQQNTALKGILNSKKDMINKLNYQVKNSNEEINRLQDQLNLIKQIKDDLQQKINSVNEIVKAQQKEIAMEKQANKLKQSKLAEVTAEISQLKEINFRQKSIILDEKQKQNQSLNEQLSIRIEEISKRYFKEEHKQTSRMTKNNRVTISNSSSNKKISNTLTLLLSNFEDKISQQIQIFLTQKKHYQKDLNQRKQENQRLKTTNNHLQVQINESMQLFEQQMKTMEELKLKIKQKNAENIEIKTNTKQKTTERQEVLFHLTRRLSLIIKNYFLQTHHELIDKLINLTASGSRKFQLQIIVHELQTTSEQSYHKILKNSISLRQYQKLNRQHTQLMQSYELQQLKFTMLQREYRQILQDNNRLIKYSTLTKYRANRNISPFGHKSSQSKSQLSSSNNTPSMHNKNNRVFDSSNKENQLINY